MQNPLGSMPPITRTYVFVAMATWFLTQYDFLKASYLMFIPARILHHHEYWRLVTGFFYFSAFSTFDFLLYMFFLYRSLKRLEQGEYRRRLADFCWMLLILQLSLVLGSFYLPPPWRYNLGTAFCYALMYIWGRRNPHIPFRFFFIPLTAPYLAFAFAAFSAVFQRVPFTQLLGIFCGHIIYYWEYVYPKLPGRSSFQPLRAPNIVRRLFGEAQIFYEYVPPQEGF